MDQPQTRNAEKHFPNTSSETRCKPGVCGECWIRTKMPKQQLLSKALLGLTTFLHKKTPLESPQLSEVCNRGSRSEREPIHEPERTEKRPATRLWHRGRRFASAATQRAHRGGGERGPGCSSARPVSKQGRYSHVSVEETLAGSSSLTSTREADFRSRYVRDPQSPPLLCTRHLPRLTSSPHKSGSSQAFLLLSRVFPNRCDV